jgi:hypothetical protein
MLCGIAATSMSGVVPTQDRVRVVLQCGIAGTV